MQNHAFWCIFGSENGQLLTGTDPEGTARGRGLGGEGWRRRHDVRASKAPSRRRWKHRWVGMGKGFPPPQPTTESGSVVSSPSGIGSGALAENGFQCCPSVTECISLRCLFVKLMSFQKAYFWFRKWAAIVLTGASRRHGWERGLGWEGVTLNASPSEAPKAPSLSQSKRLRSLGNVELLSSPRRLQQSYPVYLIKLYMSQVISYKFAEKCNAIL